MTSLVEAPVYESGIYELEITDPVTGGENGIANLPSNQLANRTSYLKDQLILLGIDVSALSSTVSNLSGVVSGVGVTNASIVEQINNIKNNYMLNGLEGELFFYNLAFS